jgi:hypothetical protein
MDGNEIAALRSPAIQSVGHHHCPA